MTGASMSVEYCEYFVGRYEQLSMYPGKKEAEVRGREMEGHEGQWPLFHAGHLPAASRARGAAALLLTHTHTLSRTYATLTSHKGS